MFQNSTGSEPWPIGGASLQASLASAGETGMQGLAPSEIFQFEDFRLDRRSGGLFKYNGADKLEPIAIGSRALDILGVLI